MGSNQGSKCKLKGTKHLTILGNLINVEHVTRSHKLPKPSMNENMKFVASCPVSMCLTQTWIVAGFGEKLHVDLSCAGSNDMLHIELEFVCHDI